MVSAKEIEANPNKVQAVQDMQIPCTVKQVQSLNVAALIRFVFKATDQCVSFDPIKKGILFIWNEDCTKAFEATSGDSHVLSNPVDREDLFFVPRSY